MTAPTRTPDYQQPITDWHRPLANATFRTARSIEEAVAAGAEDEDVRYIAGGTALVRLGRWGGSIGPALVWIGGIEELRGLTSSDDGYRIGAGVVNGRLVRDEQLAQDAPVLGQAARWIAGTAVRNLGTVGGNVAVDGSLGPALVALGGEVVLRSSSGERTVDVDAFAAGEGFDEGNPLITAVRVRTDLPAQSYQAMSGASAAAAMRFDGDVCAAVRLGLGGLDLATRRLTDAEALLTGQQVTDDLVTQVGEIAYRSAGEGQDPDADFDYLREMARVMTERAVDAAAGRPLR